MRRIRVLVPAAVALLAATVISGCSSSKKDNSGGGGGGGGANDRGPITVVQGKDNSNTIPTLTEMWNKDHPNEKVTFKQQSDSADDQLKDDEQHFQAKDSSYDIVSVDVVWTAEFAAKGWLQPLSGNFALDTSKLLPATVKAATYNNTVYAMPFASDGAMLYYRKDIIQTPPTTWDELIADCAKKGSVKDCYAGQFANYEGLTCNVGEVIAAAGGQFVKDDGKTPNVNTPEAAKGLDFLVNGFKKGYIPKEAIGYKETESLNSFIAGNLLFMRQWPYGVAIANDPKSSKIVGKFGYAPLPGPNGHGASTLGGHSMGISAYSKHKGTALDFLKFMISDPVQKFLLTQASLAPVVGALYTDPDLVAKAPYLPVLLKSIETAVPRPVTPFYPGVTKAIQDNAYAALQGQKSTQQALADMQSAIQSATAGG